jgi:serine/threonine protein kinase
MRIAEKKPVKNNQQHRSDLPYKIDDVIDGKFKVRKVLGRGGFGIVYLVQTIDGNDIYALKTLLSKDSNDYGDEQQFAKEVKTWL